VSAQLESLASTPAAKWSPRDAVLITRGGEPDRRIIYVNRAFCALTGFKPDEVIGEDGDLLLSDGSLQMPSPQCRLAAATAAD
jgi:PAS domain-containing protein